MELYSLIDQTLRYLEQTYNSIDMRLMDAEIEVAEENEWFKNLEAVRDSIEGFRRILESKRVDVEAEIRKSDLLKDKAKSEHQISDHSEEKNSNC